MINLDKKSYNKWVKYIRHCIKPYKEVDEDDLISAGNYGLVMALKNYKPNKGNLNAYIKKVIHFNIIRAIKYQKYPLQGHQWCYIDNLLKEETEDIAILSEDLQITDENDTTDTYKLKVYTKIKEYFTNGILNERESRILLYKLLGISFEEIAEKYNLTYSTIRNHFTKIKRKVEQYEHRERHNTDDK